MRKINLIILCSSAFLYACDGANDTANKAVAEKAADNVAATTGTTVETVEEAVTELDSAAEEVPAETVSTSSEVAAAVDTGESIYKTKCIACHGSGAAGAPKLGDKAAWAPRIAQGEAVLIQHAIEGFKGATGYMPAKGGFAGLSDEQISSVVEYMVSQSK